MTEEDKNRIVTLNGGSETTYAPEKTTTVREPKTIVKTEQTLNGFLNPDNTPNQAALDEFNRRKADMAKLFGVNADTGKVDDQNKFLTDVLHIDPDLMRKKREAEMELNRRKQKESAWYNSLAVLGDMVTTATGGNVWKRQPDQRAKAAHDTNLALEREQQAEDAANAKRVRTAEQAYAQAVQKLRDTVGEAYKTKVQKTLEEGGGSVSTKERGNSKTTSWRQAFKPKDKSDDDTSGGRNGDWVMNINYKNGSKPGYPLNQREYEAVTDLLKGHYNTILDQKDSNGKRTKRAEELEKKLKTAGILSSDRRAKREWNDRMILHYGEYFDLDDGLRKRIEEATNGKVHFASTWEPAKKNKRDTSDLND